MIPRSRFFTVFFLFVIVAAYLALHSDAAVPMNRSFSEFPTTVGQWQMVKESFMTADVQRVLKATDYLSRHYVDADGKTVELYVGFHNGGKNSGAIHSPKHCLPGSGWFEVSTGHDTISTSQGTLAVNRAVYQKGGEKLLFLYWYQVRNKAVASELSLKAEEILNSALHGRKDSSFIRISVPFDQDESAVIARGKRFVADVLPVIRGYLPQ